jgi:hypothetical protein
MQNSCSLWPIFFATDHHRSETLLAEMYTALAKFVEMALPVFADEVFPLQTLFVR